MTSLKLFLFIFIFLKHIQKLIIFIKDKIRNVIISRGENSKSNKTIIQLAAKK